MAKIHDVESNDGRKRYGFLCPGCNGLHIISEAWQFNNDYNKPTINPSIKVSRPHGKIEVCHSFIKDGNIQFLSDSNHSLAGQTIEIPDTESIEDILRKDTSF